MATPIRRTGGVTHIGLNDELYEIPDCTVQVNESGMWTIVQTYECDYDSVLRLCPKPYSQHRTYQFALLSGIAITRGEAGRARLECTYKGVTADFRPPGSSYTYAPGETYELIATTGEEPIETHPRYSTLTPDELAQVRKYCDDPTGPRPLGDNSVAQELIEKKLKGIESYLVPGLTYRVSYVSRSGPVSVADAGKLSNPPGAPTLANGQTWILIGYNSRRQGGAYEVSLEWRASGAGGWDTDLYQ